MSIKKTKRSKDYIQGDRAYVRVSTLKDSQQDSPEHQEALIREHAQRANVEIDGVYEDRDTATSIVSRDDVQRMINDAKRGEIRSIWFASLSRFSRDALDALSLKRILVNALKIRVVSIEDGYDSSVKDDELVFGIRSVVNQNTSGDISVSSRRGIRASAAAGNFTGTYAPYGYKKMKDGKKKWLIIDPDNPEKAKIARMIFDLYMGGMGEKEIVKFLNGDDGKREAVPAPRGGLWGISTINTILKNENYTGYCVYGKHTNEVSYNNLDDLMDRGKKLVMKPKSEWEKTDFQTHEAIITKEEFDQIQEERLIRNGDTHGGRRDFVNVFAKLIFCRECGSAMVSMSSNMRGKKYRYLLCSRRRRMGPAGCDNGNYIPYYEMRDELIGEILRKMKASIAALELKGANDISVALPDNNFEKEIRKLGKRIEDNRKLLFEIRRQNMLGEIDKMQYQFEKEQYEKEIEASEKRLNSIKAEEKRSLDVVRIIKETKIALRELTKIKSYDNIEQTRPLLLKAIQRIEVDKETNITIQTFI